jgi:hypothetical protein
VSRSLRYRNEDDEDRYKGTKEIQVHVQAYLRLTK